MVSLGGILHRTISKPQYSWSLSHVSCVATDPTNIDTIRISDPTNWYKYRIQQIDTNPGFKKFIWIPDPTKWCGFRIRHIGILHAKMKCVLRCWVQDYCLKDLLDEKSFKILTSHLTTTHLQSVLLSFYWGRRTLWNIGTSITGGYCQIVALVVWSQSARPTNWSTLWTEKLYFHPQSEKFSTH